jgi:hypothetical protein
MIDQHEGEAALPLAQGIGLTHQTDLGRDDAPA